MRVIFDTYRPDIDPVISGGQALTTAQNVRKEPVGYSAIGALTAQAPAALDGTIRGISGNVFGTTSGSPYVFAGTGAKLWRIFTLASGWSDVSIAGGYTVGSNSRWDFCAFANSIIAVAPSTAPQTMVTAGAGLMANLSANAPQAFCCMSLGNHVVFGNVVDSVYGLGTMRNAIWWCSIGNPASWPQPGTSTAIAAQSDYRQLSGNGGDVMSLIAAYDVGYIFQRKAIWRMTYVGGDSMYEITKVSSERGCTINSFGAVLPIGIFMLDDDGFYIFDGASITPIQEGKAGRAFLTLLGQGNRDRISIAANGDRKELGIAFATDTTPNYIFLYNWALDEATIISQSLEWLMPFGRGKDCHFGAFSTSHQLGFFEGSNMAATLETGDIEANPGGRSTVVSVRPFVQGATPTITCQIGTKNTLSGSLTWSSAKSLNSWGVFDCLEDARYHRIRLLLASSTWTSVTGCDAEFRPSGWI